MSASILSPFDNGTATEVGPRTFRKQVLKLAEIPYKDGRLKFDRDYLAKAVDSFGKAFDQVPFVLADGENRHSVEPERFRGEVKRLELAGDGIDALIELTEEGAQVVRDNPKLGVSVRLVPDVERDGATFPVAIEHVCGTLSPRVPGMKPWEVVSLSSVRSRSQDEERVIDLSASDYMPDTKTLTDEHLDALKGLEGEARIAKARELLGEMTVEDKSKQTTDPAEPKLKDKLKGLIGIGNDEEEDFDQAIEALLEDAKETEPEKEPVALSDSDRKVIDLARTEAREARRETAESNWKLERAELTSKGVPPAMLDLAEPVLKTGQKATIDLSASEQADAAEVIRSLLKAAEGTVDLSKETGSSEDADERTEAKTQAEKFGKENT